MLDTDHDYPCLDLELLLIFDCGIMRVVFGIPAWKFLQFPLDAYLDLRSFHAKIEALPEKELMLQRSIVIRLLDDFAGRKSTKDLGCYLAVPTLESIGEGNVRENTGDALSCCFHRQDFSGDRS
ncbi:hypothetical protein WN943_028954 [Citrus x changshan-huyou]